MKDMDMSNGLRLLAAWIDLKYPNDPEPQVQDDLMRWADEIEALRTNLKRAIEIAEEFWTQIHPQLCSTRNYDKYQELQKMKEGL